MNNYIKKNIAAMIIFLFIFSLAYSVNSHSTKTISNSKTSEPCNGYTLICAGSDPVFLIDMDKNVIQTMWMNISISLRKIGRGISSGNFITGVMGGRGNTMTLNAREIRLGTTPLVRTL